MRIRCVVVLAVWLALAGCDGGPSQDHLDQVTTGCAIGIAQKSDPVLEGVGVMTLLVFLGRLARRALEAARRAR